MAGEVVKAVFLANHAMPDHIHTKHCPPVLCNSMNYRPQPSIEVFIGVNAIKMPSLIGWVRGL